ncbi:unnamed protein product, partial [Polarella glacialis]
GGASRAWSMLEAMINDLGLNNRSSTTPSPPFGTGSAQEIVEGDDTDDEVVAEALAGLEEEGRVQLQREAQADQDIQQLLEEAPGPPLQHQTHAQCSAKNSSSSRQEKINCTSGGQTPCGGAPGEE